MRHYRHLNIGWRLWTQAVATTPPSAQASLHADCLQAIREALPMQPEEEVQWQVLTQALLMGMVLVLQLLPQELRRRTP